MRKNYVGAWEYMFATKGTIDKNQHWYGKSYQWTLDTYSRPKGWIGNILQSVW